jgi:hypothetical protein
MSGTMTPCEPNDPLLLGSIYSRSRKSFREKRACNAREVSEAKGHGTPTTVNQTNEGNL